MTLLRYGFFFGLLFLCHWDSFAVELSTTILPVSDGGTANISLSKYNISNNEDQAFTQLIIINKNTNFAIDVNDIPDQVYFITVQIHTYIHDVSMSYDKTPTAKSPGKFVNGTNIGLFIETSDSTTATVYVTNKHYEEVYGLIAVVAYTIGAPYPGGCNMEFVVEKSPFQKLTYDDATVTVDAQPASIPKIGSFEPPCEKYPLQHDAYRMYMLEQDFSNATYFLAISNMLTVKDIQKNADLIPASLYGSSMRRVYSVYPGTGSVYSMVAHFANHSSAYIPIVTYGCDPSSPYTCSILISSFSKCLCASALFLGIFVAMRGQHYFKFSMFLVGMISGGFVGYAISKSAGSVDPTATTYITIFCGILTSFVWLLLWLILNSPIPSLIISSVTLGSFFFYIFYFTIPVGLLYMESDVYYWLLFTTFIVLAILIFSVIPLIGNILCFTLLGAYAAVVSIDYYSGSNLKYIMINGIRRISVSNFNVAVIQPPYQDKDLLFTVFWFFLVIMGLYKQCATNWNRAPFPPSTPNLVRDNERTPLLLR